MSLRSSRLVYLGGLVALLSSLGCPGPTPSADGTGSGGDDAQSVASTSTQGPGPGPGPQSSTQTGPGSTGNGGDEGPGTSSTSGPGGGHGDGGAGGRGDGGAGGRGHGGAGGAGGDNQGGSGGGCNADLDNDPLNCGACGRACDGDDVLADDGIECKQGVCTSECRDGASNLIQPVAPADDDGCETKWPRVFVSDLPVGVPFDIADPDSGAFGADHVCMTLAGEQDLDGTWMAWVSDAQSSPATRFTLQSDLPYVLFDRSIVADDWTDLTNGGIDHAIDLSEAGAQILDGDVWTGTRPNGTAVPGGNCFAWADPGTDGALFTVGNSSAIDGEWTQGETLVDCSGDGGEDALHYIYCFQQ